MADERGVLCIGEILWDALPGGLYLGGAPLNVCFHLNQLGIRSDMCSKVGDDRLGKEALQRIKGSGISTKYIQTDHSAETGFVKVEVEENGDPSYDIIKPAAWDFIEKSAVLEEIAGDSWGLVFGSLGQRHAQSRSAIRGLWNYDFKKILDLNLRPPYIDKKIIRDSLEVADVIKMNEDELARLMNWFALPGDLHGAVEELAMQFKCSMICITAGESGAMLFQDRSWYRHEGYRAKVKDSVGAGDAFLAALIHGIQHQKEGVELLKYANAAGSLVAQRDGATPEYNHNDLIALVSYLK